MTEMWEWRAKSVRSLTSVSVDAIIDGKKVEMIGWLGRTQAKQSKQKRRLFKDVPDEWHRGGAWDAWKPSTTKADEGAPVAQGTQEVQEDPPKDSEGDAVFTEAVTEEVPKLDTAGNPEKDVNGDAVMEVKPKLDLEGKPLMQQLQRKRVAADAGGGNNVSRPPAITKVRRVDDVGPPGLKVIKVAGDGHCGFRCVAQHAKRGRVKSRRDGKAASNLTHDKARTFIAARMLSKSEQYLHQYTGEAPCPGGDEAGKRLRSGKGSKSTA